MSSSVERQPDAWQQNANFIELLGAPGAKQALATLEKHLKPIFNSHAFYSLETGMLTVKLRTLTSLLTDANLLPRLTPHDFKLGLHLAITPTLSQSASPSKDQPLHFDSFVNAIAFCAYYYPPGANPLEVPNLRATDFSGSLEVTLNNARDRLVASTNSPRSIVDEMASPATTLAFTTPQTNFPASSPTESIASGASSGPVPEQWFTPAHSAIRTKLFSLAESNSPDVSNEVSGDDANLRDAISPPNANDDILERKTLSEACSANPLQTAGDIDAAPQYLEKEQDFPSPTPSFTTAEKPCHLPSEGSVLQNEGISSPQTSKSHVCEEESSHQQVEPVPEVDEPSDEQNVSESPLATSAVVPSPSLSPEFAANPGNETQQEAAETPKIPCNSTPESASANLSLAPSTALSQLPSPEGSFESPELAGDPSTPHNASSIEPMSSRKLSFSDSDDASDMSSCYENGTDNEATLTRIENAFEDDETVADCDQESPRSDLLSAHTRLPSSEHESTVLDQSTMDVSTVSEINLVNTGLQSSSEGEAESETEAAFQTGAHGFSDAHSIASNSDSDSDSFYSDAMFAQHALDEIAENEETYTFDETHDMPLRKPKITLGPPAGAFSEAGETALQTPIPPITVAMFPDAEMDDIDEEDHTLLFENGNESDGSELSMRTRETMGKMVEDYLSLHGTATPQSGPDENFYAEEQILTTPDRQSHVTFCDKTATDRNKIVEEGPCVSEKAESKQSRISCFVESSIRDSEKVDDTDKQGFEVQMDSAEHITAENAVSPMQYSQKDSFFSEITPDGLNLIKKQLVLPSPFVFTDSTVGSSMSSGSSTGKSDRIKTGEETGKCEQKGTLAVSVKKGEAVEEKVVTRGQQDTNGSVTEVDMMRVMLETLETCRVLREEVVKKQHSPQEGPQQQQCPHHGGFGRWIEFGLFGLVVVIVILVLVERRIQRGVFLDVLV